MATIQEKAWYSRGNVLCSATNGVEARTAEFFYALKEFLIGAGESPDFPRWTLIGSSDGVTAGLDGVDRWDTPAKIKRRSTATGPVCWIALRSSDASAYVVIAWESTGAGDSTRGPFEIRCGPNAPTGVITTTIPTPGGGFRHAASNNSIYIGHREATDCRAHFATASDGSFVLCVNTVGRGSFSTLIFFNRLADARSTDPFPYTIFVDSLDAGVPHLTNTITGWSSTTRGFSMVRHNGGATRAACATLYGNGTGYAQVFLTQQDANDPIDTRPDFHLYMVTDEPSVRGRLSDIRGCLENTADGSVDSLAQPKSFTCGIFWLPIAAVPDMS